MFGLFMRQQFNAAVNFREWDNADESSILIHLCQPVDDEWIGLGFDWFGA